MKATAWIIAIIMVLAAATGVVAGEKKKCTAAADECIAKLKAKIAAKGWLGVETDKNDHKKVVVTSVFADSPAAKAGFKEGDIFLAINGINYYSDDEKDKEKRHEAWAPGNQVTFTVKRNSAKQDIVVTLGHVPEDVAKQWIKKHLKEQHPDYKG